MISTRRKAPRGVVHEMADLGIDFLCGSRAPEPFEWTGDPVTCKRCERSLARKQAEADREELESLSEANVADSVIHDDDKLCQSEKQIPIHLQLGPRHGYTTFRCGRLAGHLDMDMAAAPYTHRYFGEGYEVSWLEPA